MRSSHIRLTGPAVIVAAFILHAVFGAVPGTAQTSSRRDGTPAAGAPGTSQPRASVSYHVAANTNTESFAVSAEIKGIAADTMTFFFPVWGPGAYDIVDFGKYVSEFRATTAAGRALKVEKSDVSTYRIIGPEAVTRISYVVDDIESVPNSLWFGLSDVEPTYAFANTPAIFGYPAGYKNIPYTVSYVVPKGWDIAIGLDPAPGKAKKGEYAYVAADYDDLVDAPVTMGKFQRLEFNVRGVPHIIAVFAPQKLSPEDARELTDVSKKIVSLISDFYGELPYKRYVFQHFLVELNGRDNAFGALEHRNSSTYRMPFMPERVIGLLQGVIAHEYWHTWSPKRIHVAELGPFDYQRAPRTKSLWFAEGITEYYAKILLTRAQMADEDEVLELLNSAGRIAGKPQRMSITELSDKVADLPLNEVVALYSKGPLLALLLDAEIRIQTGNAKSLDDAMRYFNERYGRTGKTFGDDDIIPEMERATGAKLQEFYRRYIDGRDSLPLAAYLPKIGFAMHSQYEEMMGLGGEAERTEEGWMITSVLPGGSADLMKLRTGDVLKEIKFARSAMAMSNIPINLAGSLLALPEIKGFTVKRGTETFDVEAKVVKSRVAVQSVTVDRNAPAQAAALRKSMFGF